MAETAVKNVEYLLRKRDTDSWKEFEHRLLIWRNTPSSHETLSPAQRFYGRRQRGAFSVFTPMPQIRPEGQPKGAVGVKYEIGDRVSLQDIKTKRWIGKGTIAGIRVSGRSYFIHEDGEPQGKLMVRNRIYLRKLHESSVNPDNPDLSAANPDHRQANERAGLWQRPGEPRDSDPDTEPELDHSPTRRSTRKRNTIVRFSC
jgi:hypothetical protein